MKLSQISQSRDSITMKAKVCPPQKREQEGDNNRKRISVNFLSQKAGEGMMTDKLTQEAITYCLHEKGWKPTKEPNEATELQV